MSLRKGFLLSLCGFFSLLLALLAFMGTSFVRESFRQREVLGRLVANRVYSNLLRQTCRVQRQIPHMLEGDMWALSPDMKILTLLNGNYSSNTFRGDLPVGYSLGDVNSLWSPRQFLTSDDSFLLIRRFTWEGQEYLIGLLPDFNGVVPADLIGEGFGLALCDDSGHILWNDGYSPFVERGHIARTFISSTPGWHRAPWGGLVWSRIFSIPLGGLRLFVSYPLEKLLPAIIGKLVLPATLALIAFVLLFSLWIFVRRQILDPVDRARLVALSTGTGLDRRKDKDTVTHIIALGESMDDLSRKSGLSEIRDFGQAFSRTLKTIARKEEELLFYSEALTSMNQALEETNQRILHRDLVWKQTLETSQAITRDGAREGLLEHLCDIVIESTGAFGVALGQISGDSMEAVIFRGFGGTALPGFTVSLRHSKIGEAVLRSRPIWVNDTSGIANYQPISPLVRSEVNIPLFHLGKAVGGMTLCWADKFDEDPTVLETVLPLAAYVAGTLDAERSKNELRESYHYLVNRLQHVTAIYHEETAAHLSRTEAYCRFFAERSGYSPEEVDDIGFFSRLHDIGKLRVPRDILAKTGPLTEREFDVVKNHTLWGANILGDAAWLTTGRRICLSHHEKWDGSGYPHGLAGEAIPREARIMALADVYDALRSPRCYKPARSHQDVVRVILEGDGRVMPGHFAPELLEIFRKEHEGIALIYEHFSECSTLISSDGICLRD